MGFSILNKILKFDIDHKWLKFINDNGYLSCIINTSWSFSSKLSRHVIFKFGIVSIIGLLVSVSVSWITEELGVGYLFGIFFVVIISPAITFILHNFWTYKNSQSTN